MSSGGGDRLEDRVSLGSLGGVWVFMKAPMKPWM